MPTKKTNGSPSTTGSAQQIDIEEYEATPLLIVGRIDVLAVQLVLASDEKTQAEVRMKSITVEIAQCDKLLRRAAVAESGSVMVDRLTAERIGVNTEARATK